MRSFIIIAILAAGAAACGKNAPTSPSNSAPAATTPGASAGATISGTVQSDASTLATHSGASLTGVTVTVVGTAISTNVDGAGHFSLSSVPAGDVQLRFTGAADATLPVGTVEATETVDLVINVSGSSASIESEVRNGAAEAQLEGKIEALPPTTAALTFKAVGRTVKTDSSTQFVDGGATRSFADLALGMRVHVKGTFANDVMTARWIELQSPQLTPPTTPTPPEDTSASIHGTLKSMSGTKPALTLTVDTTRVHTFASTDVKRRGDFQTLDALQLGQTLHVIGTRKSDGSIDARLIEIDDDAVGGEFQIEGAVGGLKGSCPAVTFGVNGFSIATSGSTTFEGGACSALKNGSKVTIKGTRLADGSVAATSVKQN